MNFLQHLLSHQFTVSKRLLGVLLLTLGTLAILGILAIDLFDSGRQGGIGPAQQMALLAAAAGAIVGLILIPLGDRPA